MLWPEGMPRKKARVEEACARGILKRAVECRWRRDIRIFSHASGTPGQEFLTHGFENIIWDLGWDFSVQKTNQMRNDECRQLGQLHASSERTSHRLKEKQNSTHFPFWFEMLPKLYIYMDNNSLKNDLARNNYKLSCKLNSILLIFMCNFTY